MVVPSLLVEEVIAEDPFTDNSSVYFPSVPLLHLAGLAPADDCQRWLLDART